MIRPRELNSAGYLLRNSHEKRNPCRSGRRLRAGALEEAIQQGHRLFRWVIEQVSATAR
jgi:hypothetical protein